MKTHRFNIMLTMIPVLVGIILYSFVSTAFGQFGSVVYEFDVIAETGTMIILTDPAEEFGPVDGLGQGPSINDDGDVAFIAGAQDDVRTFVKNGDTVDRERFFPTQDLSNNMQINNVDQFVFQFRDNRNGDTFMVRDDDIIGPDPAIAIGSNFFTATPFNFVYPWPSLNNSGRGIVGADLKTGVGTVLATRDSGTGPHNTTNPLPGFPNFFPMMADNNTTIVRAGGAPTSPLFLLSDETLKFAFVIAESPTFSAIGEQPGISDDGVFIVFAGIHSSNGEGIFGEIGGGIPPFKIAGVSEDGHLDPGESFGDTNGNGQFDPGEGEVDIGFFNGLNIDSRVGVNLSGGGSTKIFTVAYLATDFSDRVGLYTSQVDITDPLDIKISVPTLVAEEGSPIAVDGKFTFPVQAIDIYDPVNNKGEIIFWVQASNGALGIIRAAPINKFEFEIVDPNPDLLDGEAKVISPNIPSNIDRLAKEGQIVKAGVTDGITKIILRVKSDTPLDFLILDEDFDGLNGSLSTINGDEETSQLENILPHTSLLGESFVFVVYTFPDVFSMKVERLTDFSRRIFVQVRNSSDGTSMNIPLILERPPVVLVPPPTGVTAHIQDTFFKWGNELAKNGYSIFPVEYTKISDLEAKFNPRINVEQNRPIKEFIETINDTKFALRNRGVAVTQVDAVSYSAGGLVVRAVEIVEGFNYKRQDNYFKGDVRRLVTFAAPHLGSELANWALEQTKKSSCIDRAFEAIGQDVDPNGYRVDEAANSETIQLLMAHKNKSLIRVHPIIGTANSCAITIADIIAKNTLNEKLDNLALEGLCPSTTIDIGFVKTISEIRAESFFPGFDKIFESTEHDTVVRKSSQQNDFIRSSEFHSILHGKTIRLCFTGDYFRSVGLSGERVINMDTLDRVINLFNIRLSEFE